MGDWNDRKGARAGFWTTVAFHLGVLVVLLLVSIGAVAEKEHTFVLDFSRQEEAEQRQEEERHEMEIKEEAARQLISQLSGTPQVRNVRVDAGSLKDDRHKNPSSIYKEAEDLQKRLDASRRDAMREAASAEERVDTSTAEDSNSKGAEDTPAYTGPSVLTYKLDGRKARSLPIPAYKGFAGGDIYVAILVNKAGRVTGAPIIQGPSSSDKQLQQYALEAARRSRFSPSDTAPDPQGGEIVYRFIAQ